MKKIEQYGQLKDEEGEGNNSGTDMFHFDSDEDVFCVYSQYIDDISLFSRLLREACNDEQRMRDYIDINFDSQHTEKLLNLLSEYGYKVDTDWKPVRIELYSEKYGYLDIHPFVLNTDGTAKQADLEGGWYEFEKDFFGNAVFEGKTIPCISVKGQKIFHSGYDLRDKDKHDISILESISG